MGNKVEGGEGEVLLLHVPKEQVGVNEARGGGKGGKGAMGGEGKGASRGKGGGKGRREGTEATGIWGRGSGCCSTSQNSR